jgi:hypothetical protein
MSAYLQYLDGLAARMHDLISKKYITASKVSFPVMQPRIGDVTVHCTEYGTLLSIGDRFSSKILSDWSDIPVLYDIYTNDTIGPLEFLETNDVDGFMRQRATLEFEARSDDVATIIRDHYASEFNKVCLTWP